MLTTIAHKELIQVPAFVAEVWRPILSELKYILKEPLEEIYLNLHASTTKVLKKLRFPEGHDEEKLAVRKFVKSLDKKELQSFLIFCTGISMYSTKIKTIVPIVN